MGHSHLQCARNRQADHGDRADEHADCDELAFAIPHCMPHLRCSPERSLRSACNRLTSAASRPGSGEETTSANVVRNLPASVSGSCIVWSSGTRTVGRRIATGSSEGNLTPGGFASLCQQCDIGEFVRGEWLFFSRGKDSNGGAAGAPSSLGCQQDFSLLVVVFGFYFH